MSRLFSTCNGVVVPEKFRSSVFSVFVEPAIVRPLTVIEPGKLTGVDGLIATPFQPVFVINTDCELLGKAPSDHDDGLSQFPLAGFIHELTCAKTEVEVNT